MARAIWKGAISFGLVHIPVALVSATSSSQIDFDWLDKRSMDPVGYQRINKATGKPVDKDDIVKGVKYDSGQYVIISDEEIRGALPQLTQTIDIFAFIEASEIPLELYDTPYYLAPDRRGEKVYALLRETLNDSGRVALAHVVIRTRQHLTALMAGDDALTLMLLRWPSDVRGIGTLELSDGVHPKLAAREREMARALVDEMTSEWQPDEYRDTFSERINELIDQKARAGKLKEVSEADAEPRRSADIIDIAELLKRSLSGGKGKARATTRTQRAATGRETKSDDDKPAGTRRSRTKASTTATGKTVKKAAPTSRKKSPTRGGDKGGSARTARHGCTWCAPAYPAAAARPSGY